MEEGLICEHNSLWRKCYVCELERDLLTAVEALQKMDDRKQPMIPRSQMARIAKEALDKIIGV